MLDTLQVIMWSLTYVLIIVAGIQSRSIRKISMPYIAGVLNFAWEICALYTSGGMWGHVLWLTLDLLIVFFGFIYASTNRGRMIYVASIVISTVLLMYVFTLPRGMMISVFLIDLIMAVCYLLECKKLSPKLKTSIAVTKLLGDMFAGLCYARGSIFVAIVAGVVFVCNCYYLRLCIEEASRE